MHTGSELELGDGTCLAVSGSTGRPLASNSRHPV